MYLCGVSDAAEGVMISALLSFLGGSAFRLIWAEVSGWIQERRDHQHELERLRLQEELDAKQHARNLEAIRLQADLGVKVIEVQAAADMGRTELEAWAGAVKESMRPTGIYFVDAWNGIIRPLAASIAIVLWVAALNEQGWKMTEWDKELVGAILGFFFATRALVNRGKEARS